MTKTYRGSTTEATFTRESRTYHTSNRADILLNKRSMTKSLDLLHTHNSISLSRVHTHIHKKASEKVYLPQSSTYSHSQESKRKFYLHRSTTYSRSLETKAKNSMSLGRFHTHICTNNERDRPTTPLSRQTPVHIAPTAASSFSGPQQARTQRAPTAKKLDTFANHGRK